MRLLTSRGGSAHQVCANRDGRLLKRRGVPSLFASDGSEKQVEAPPHIKSHTHTHQASVGSETHVERGASSHQEAPLHNQGTHAEMWRLLAPRGAGAHNGYIKQRWGASPHQEVPMHTTGTQPETGRLPIMRRHAHQKHMPIPQSLLTPRDFSCHCLEQPASIFFVNVLCQRTFLHDFT